MAESTFELNLGFVCFFVCLILEDREIHGRYRSKEKHHPSYSLQQ